MYRIAANRALNRCKTLSKEKGRRADFDETVPPQIQAPEARQRLLQSEREDRVRTLLAVLPPEQRICIVLREIEALSYEEIANTLKLNINTVRTRLKRAREALMAYARKEVIHREL